MPITALGFLAVFSVGCLVALKRPFVGLLLYFFVFYMHPPGKYWGSFLPEMRWTLIVAVVTLFSTLIYSKDKMRWLSGTETKFLLCFLVFVFIQWFFVNHPVVHKLYLILLLKLVVLYFLIITLVNTKKRLLAVIVVNAICSAYIGLNALQTHTRGRFEAAGLPGIEDGNLLSIHLVPIIFISSSILLLKLPKKYFIFLPLALTANLLFMTGSRGGIAGLIVAGVFLFVFCPKEIKSVVKRWGLLAVILGLFLAGPLLLNRLEQAMVPNSEGKIDKSAYSRLVIINSQVEMFKDYPLFGYGHRGTLNLSIYYVDEEYMTSTAVGSRRASHNITMAYLVDHGLFGFVLIFGAIVIGILRVRDAKKLFNYGPEEATILLFACSGLVGVIVSSQFSNSKVLEITFWLLALISATHQLLLENKPENNKVFKRLKRP